MLYGINIKANGDKEYVGPEIATQDSGAFIGFHYGPRYSHYDDPLHTIEILVRPRRISDAALRTLASELIELETTHTPQRFSFMEIVDGPDAPHAFFVAQASSKQSLRYCLHELGCKDIQSVAEEEYYLIRRIKADEARRADPDRIITSLD